MLDFFFNIWIYVQVDGWKFSATAKDNKFPLHVNLHLQTKLTWIDIHVYTCTVMYVHMKD